MLTARRTRIGRTAYQLAGLIPPIRRLRRQRDELAAEVERLRFAQGLAPGDQEPVADVGRSRPPGGELYPAGHFYSPLPDLEDIRRRENSIFAIPQDIQGVRLDVEQQLERLTDLKPQFDSWPYSSESDARRYRPDNDFFGYVDSHLLFAMLDHHRPRKYLEIGSGWSSAVVLDLMDSAPDWPVEALFVEPYPDRLHSLLTAGDRGRVTIVAEPVQAVSLDTLTGLELGDVLFIDSTHVSRVGSDVNYLLFEVLPRLASGVFVHVHDIAYPFEYPREWIYEGRSWNECYLMHALLLENDHWDIYLWASMLGHLHPSAVAHLTGPGGFDGGSLWLRKR